jgi:stringent starvation protein B
MSDDEISMSSTKPYLLRAFYEWITDNELTPYLVVNAQYPRVKVPKQYVESGKIVLNISALAVKNIFMDNEAVSFSARFSGKALEVYVPIAAIIAIYARENGRGMVFGEEDEVGGEREGNAPSSIYSATKKTKSGPDLHAVTEADFLSLPEDNREKMDSMLGDDVDDKDPPPTGSGKPNLHIVK